MGNEMAKASAGLTPAVEAGSKVGARDGRSLIACTGKEEAAAGARGFDYGGFAGTGTGRGERHWGPV